MGAASRTAGNGQLLLLVVVTDGRVTVGRVSRVALLSVSVKLLLSSLLPLPILSNSKVLSRTNALCTLLGSVAI